jgi:hypothetical protein
VVDEPPVQLGGEPVDLAGQLRVGLELQFLLVEVVIRLIPPHMAMPEKALAPFVALSRSMTADI